jgi:hypothetical protein
MLLLTETNSMPFYRFLVLLVVVARRYPQQGLSRCPLLLDHRKGLDLRRMIATMKLRGKFFWSS